MTTSFVGILLMKFMIIHQVCCDKEQLNSSLQTCSIHSIIDEEILALEELLILTKKRYSILKSINDHLNIRNTKEYLVRQDIFKKKNSHPMNHPIQENLNEMYSTKFFDVATSTFTTSIETHFKKRFLLKRPKKVVVYSKLFEVNSFETLALYRQNNRNNRLNALQLVLLGDHQGNLHILDPKTQKEVFQMKTQKMEIAFLDLTTAFDIPYLTMAGQNGQICLYNMTIFRNRKLLVGRLDDKTKNYEKALHWNSTNLQHPISKPSEIKILLQLENSCFSMKPSMNSPIVSLAFHRNRKEFTFFVGHFNGKLRAFSLNGTLKSQWIHDQPIQNLMILSPSLLVYSTLNEIHFIDLLAIHQHFLPCVISVNSITSIAKDLLYPNLFYVATSKGEVFLVSYILSKKLQRVSCKLHHKLTFRKLSIDDFNVVTKVSNFYGYTVFTAGKNLAVYNATDSSSSGPVYMFEQELDYNSKDISMAGSNLPFIYILLSGSNLTDTNIHSLYESFLTYTPPKKMSMVLKTRIPLMILGLCFVIGWQYIKKTRIKQRLRHSRYRSFQRDFQGRMGLQETTRFFSKNND